jgi:predicted RNase H-like nuclease
MRVPGTLLIGFDSAWTTGNRGGIVGVLAGDDGIYEELGDPEAVDFVEARQTIAGWRAARKPERTLILLDQPTIVTNVTGKRPVEDIVYSPVCRRRGGMQPANKSKESMFGRDAPLWSFLDEFGGAADPFEPSGPVAVLETYPVLALIALGWVLEDSRPAGRLPKYNPANRRKFRQDDWKYVCGKTGDALRGFRLSNVPDWLAKVGSDPAPSKSIQDRVDACICLLVALHVVARREYQVVGDVDTGYIVVPHSASLMAEPDVRCGVLDRRSGDWVQRVKSAS